MAERVLIIPFDVNTRSVFELILDLTNTDAKKMELMDPGKLLSNAQLVIDEITTVEPTEFKKEEISLFITNNNKEAGWGWKKQCQMERLRNRKLLKKIEELEEANKKLREEAGRDLKGVRIIDKKHHQTESDTKTEKDVIMLQMEKEEMERKEQRKEKLQVTRLSKASSPREEAKARIEVVDVQLNHAKETSKEKAHLEAVKSRKDRPTSIRSEKKDQPQREEQSSIKIQSEKLNDAPRELERGGKRDQESEARERELLLLDLEELIRELYWRDGAALKHLFALFDVCSHLRTIQFKLNLYFVYH